jgi:ribosomal protein S27AE
MASVMIVCPETGREIYTGIETDETSFAKLPDVLSRTQCPICGHEHVWTRHDARLSTGRLKQVA